MTIEKKLEKIERMLEKLSFNNQVISPVGDFSSQIKDEAGFGELWNVFYSGKWIIFAVTLLFAVASVSYALSVPNVYRSEVLLAPADENSASGLSSMVGSLGGLAGFAGVNIGAGDKTTISIEVLKSRQFISGFIQKYDLLVPLMAVKGWDGVEQRLIIDENIYDEKNKNWLRKSRPPRKPEPSMQEAYEAFIKKLKVAEDKETGLIALSIEHYSPNVAKLWVELLVKSINDEIKHRDVREANESIRYLAVQLEKTSIADMKTVFYELIEEQMKTMMFAEVRDEYAFKVIDAPVVPESKSKPKRGLICILGCLMGGGLGVVLVFLYSLVRK